MAMQIVVFEDEQVSRLYPITVGRPAYAISCGSFRLIDWLQRLSREIGAALHGVVRPHLSSIQKLDYPNFSGEPPTSRMPMLLVNARLAPTVSMYRTLVRLARESQTAAISENGSLAAAMIGPGGPVPPPDDHLEHWNKYVANSVQGKVPSADVRLPLFDYPHDV